MVFFDAGLSRKQQIKNKNGTKMRNKTTKEVKTINASNSESRSLKTRK